jgi:hypothetical protein
MRTRTFVLALAALVLASSAHGFDFDSGTNQGWTYRLVNSNTGEIRTGNAGWSDINNFPSVFTDPTGDGRGSAQGVVGAVDYSSASSGDYLILQLISPDLGSSAAWQDVATFSAYLLPSIVADPFTPDLYANMAIVVYDHDEGRRRSFVTGSATTIADAEWSLRDFDVASTLASAVPPVTNYDVEQVVVNFWIAVADGRFVADILVFCVDQVSPCATVYTSEVEFRAAAGPTLTYGFETHGLSEDVNDLVPSPVPASDFAGNFGIAYTNLNGFNVAYQPGGSCNADGDRSLFTHSVVADDYSLTFFDFGGENRSVTAFGLTVCDFASGLSDPVSISYDTGTESGVMLVVPSGQPDYTSNFVGVVVCPGSAFDSITLTFDDNASGFQQFDEVIYAMTAPLDCNNNGILDEQEIAIHPSLDWNDDGIIDSCQQGQDISEVPRGDAGPVALHDARPNPFNPHTTIAFELREAGAVSLSVFDMSGRLVAVLLDNEMANEGLNEVVWRGRDMAGREVAAGVYFYRLTSGSFSETKMMALVK